MKIGLEFKNELVVLYILLSPSLSHSFPKPSAKNFIVPPQSTKRGEGGHGEISSFKIIPSLTKKSFPDSSKGQKTLNNLVFRNKFFFYFVLLTIRGLYTILRSLIYGIYKETNIQLGNWILRTIKKLNINLMRQLLGLRNSNLGN